MALGEMKTKVAAVNSGHEILYNSNYTGEAITLDTTAFTGGVCKAGTPVSATGTVANTAEAFGILLDDVYEERPQGTAVYDGTIHTTRAQESCGLTYTAAMAAALKNVVFIPAITTTGA